MLTNVQDYLVNVYQDLMVVSDDLIKLRELNIPNKEIGRDYIDQYESDCIRGVVKVAMEFTQRVDDAPRYQHCETNYERFAWKAIDSLVKQLERKYMQLRDNTFEFYKAIDKLRSSIDNVTACCYLACGLDLIKSGPVVRMPEDTFTHYRMDSYTVDMNRYNVLRAREIKHLQDFIHYNTEMGNLDDDE